MGLAISIVIAAILIAIIVRLRRNETGPDRRTAPSGRRDPVKTGSQFHAVSIQFTDTACEAAKAMADKRFLSDVAPQIPLPDCDVPQCKCRFAHHKDRRRGEDRRGRHPQNMLGTTGGFSGKERRVHERRRDDEPEDFFS